MIVKSTQMVETQCIHCGLPVPSGSLDPRRTEQFCCRGCETAYGLIHGCGLSSFYQMLDGQQAALSLKDRDHDQRFTEYDSEPFLQKFSNVVAPGQRSIKLALEGIHCAACIWLIEKLPSILPGVIETRVSWARGTAEIKWREDEIELSTILQTLNQLGYPPYPIRESEKAKRHQLENRKHLTRLGIAAALAGNNMIISAALYFGMFSHMTLGMSTLMRISSCLIGLIALLIPGRVFLQSAYQSLRTRTPHMDLPIALALIMGTIVGTLNVLRGTGEIYFDSLSVLIFLLLIGRWVQFRQQARAADSVEMLFRMTPKTTQKFVDGKYVESLVDFLTPDDLVEIRSGELLPVDGVITKGNTRLDESILTGESKPIQKSQGDCVYAGTLNTTSTIEVRATAVGDATRLSQIARLMEDSMDNRPKMVQWANQIGGYFVVSVMLLATLTFAYWLPTSLETAVDRAIALLIVACPCALALATPLAIAVAIGRAARSGIMIKDGDVFQALQHPGMLWLDKTGTLTEGDLRVEGWYGNRRYLPLVGAVETYSNHPVAKALVNFAAVELEQTGNHFGEFDGKVEEHIGAGIRANDHSQELLIGTSGFLKENVVSISPAFERLSEEVVDLGLSPCWIAFDGRAVALASIGDGLREDASLAIQELKDRGWELGILSGDHQSVCDRVATQLDLPAERVIGTASPEDKLEIIDNFRSNQTVVMVGDGVNDCAALAAATVGLAVKGGAEASLAAAPVYLSKPGLMPILELLKLSDSTVRTMKRNLLVSVGYNLTFAGLAFGGMINPLVAAILMPISSITVVALSLGAGAQSASSNRIQAEESR